MVSIALLFYFQVSIRDSHDSFQWGAGNANLKFETEMEFREREEEKFFSFGRSNRHD